MNRAQREPYLGLTRVVIQAKVIVGTKLEHPFSNGTMGLCHFCNYARWSGNPCEPESVELRCAHPLASRKLWEPYEVWEGFGADCWGFGPAQDIDEAADTLGIYLRGEVES